MAKHIVMRFFFVMLPGLVIAGCGDAEPVSAERYVGTDQLVSIIDENLVSSANLSKILDIDHSRLAQEAGSVMPPATVLIFSDPALDSELIKLNPLVALDLPLRVLAFEDVGDSASKVIYNSFDFLVSRYQLGPGATKSLRTKYNHAMSEITKGVPPEAMASFASDEMKPDGVITIESPYGYQETIDRVKAAINEQKDTVHFGVVDFQANARELGIELNPSYLILFGGPGPGGKAMADAPTLGLDGFCQKFLVWEDASGGVNLSFNDLLALAERQGVTKALALRVINFRLNQVFSDALASD
ncbi:Uncharacterised protein [Halioglobus japonicus]|nr:Uncharacterised protein [Halioglobus japonicus]